MTFAALASLPWQGSGASPRCVVLLSVTAAVERARQLGCGQIYALSTQAAGYLEREGFVRTHDLSLLPEERREKWAKNGRNAVLLVRRLG